MQTVCMWWYRDCDMRFYLVQTPRRTRLSVFTGNYRFVFVVNCQHCYIRVERDSERGKECTRQRLEYEPQSRCASRALSGNGDCKKISPQEEATAFFVLKTALS